MTEVVIIGGGVVGLSLAYELARRERTVTVVDRQAMGREASWAGAGILPAANRATAVHPYDQLRGLSYELHSRWSEQLSAETGIDTGYRVCGGLYLAASSGEAAALHGWAAMPATEQIAIERLNIAQLPEHEPALMAWVERGGCRAAYRLVDEAQLRNPDHLRALAAACQQRGVRLMADTEVTRLRMRGQRVQELETSRGRLQADQFCLTTGAWTGQLLDQLQIPNGIIPVRGQMIMYRCTRQCLNHILNLGSRYIVPREDGHVLVGSTEEEVGFDKSTTREALCQLDRLATTVVAPLSAAQQTRSWAGIRPGTFDGFPYLGPLPGSENAFVAAGHFRSGLFLSPGTAVVMAERMCGEPTSVDLAPFGLMR